MPRWTSLLALVVLALMGGEAAAWADAPPAVEVHETVQPSETAAEGGAEEATWPGAGAETVAVVSDAVFEVRGAASPSSANPATPPPE